MFALGNSSYPSYCGFGTWLDSALTQLSGIRLTKIGYGDELGDRDAEYNKWSKMAYMKACLEAKLDFGDEPNRAPEESEKVVTKWLPVEKQDVEKSLSDSDILCNGNIIMLLYIALCWYSLTNLSNFSVSIPR